MNFLSIDDVKKASNIILITDRTDEKKLKINQFPSGETIILFTLSSIILILGIYPDYMIIFMNATLENMADHIITKINI